MVEQPRTFMDSWLSGRAPRSHRGSQRFESSRVHQVKQAGRFVHIEEGVGGSNPPVVTLVVSIVESQSAPGFLRLQT